jgi:hypothetical protein
MSSIGIHNVASVEVKDCESDGHVWRVYTFTGMGPCARPSVVVHPAPGSPLYAEIVAALNGIKEYSSVEAMEIIARLRAENAAQAKRIAELEATEKLFHAGVRFNIVGFRQTIEAQLAKRDSRIAELEAALDAYGKHRISCAWHALHPPYTFDAKRDPCDCGFDTALSGGRER